MKNEFFVQSPSNGEDAKQSEKMKTRAQAAVEYLIILAVVIIIALVVVGVLGGFPALTRGISERDSAAYWSGSEIAITRYMFSSKGGSSVVVRNNKPFAVNLIGVNFTVAGLAQGSGVNGNVSGTYKYLAPGESFSFNASTNCSAGAAPYAYDVVIGYQDPQYSTAYTFTGTKPLVGTCQS
jgi:hypothetical protein